MDEIQSTPEDKSYKVPVTALCKVILGDIALRAIGKYRLMYDPDGSVQAYVNVNFADKTVPAKWVEISSTDEPQKDE